MQGEGEPLARWSRGGQATPTATPLSIRPTGPCRFEFDFAFLPLSLLLFLFLSRPQSAPPPRINCFSLHGGRRESVPSVSAAAGELLQNGIAIWALAIVELLHSYTTKDRLANCITLLLWRVHRYSRYGDVFLDKGDLHAVPSRICIADSLHFAKAAGDTAAHL